MTIFVKLLSNKETNKEYFKDITTLYHILGTKVKASCYSEWERTVHKEHYDLTEFYKADCVLLVFPSRVLDFSPSDLVMIAKALVEKPNKTILYFANCHHGYLNSCVTSLTDAFEKAGSMVTTDFDNVLSYLDKCFNTTVEETNYEA